MALNTRTGPHVKGDADTDFGLVYRPIRFRSTPPAGLYRSSSTAEEKEPRMTVPAPASTFLHPSPTPSPPSGAEYSMVRRGISRSPSILNGYTPIKLRWRSEEPNGRNNDVLSAVRQSRDDDRQLSPAQRTLPRSDALSTSARFSLHPPRKSVKPGKERISPSVLYALLIVTTQEVEDRAALSTAELSEFGAILSGFRCTVEMELIRVAAFKLFRIERRARSVVSEQEHRERAIIGLWCRECLQDAQIRGTIGWPSSSRLTVLENHRGDSSRSSQYHSFSSSSPARSSFHGVELLHVDTQRNSTPIMPDAPSTVSSEVEIEDEIARRAAHVDMMSSVDLDLILGRGQTERRTSQASGGFESWPPREQQQRSQGRVSQNALASILQQEQLLDARIARQHAEAMQRGVHLRYHTNAVDITNFRDAGNGPRRRQL